MPTERVRLEPSWKARLAGEFERPYMTELRTFLVSEREARKTIYPRPAEWFAALDRAPFDQVRVVILGQDPYHGPGQAHGLCFSVRHGVEYPPSLVNIMREAYANMRERGEAIEPIPAEGYDGCLAPWAEQGVLLLNASLTVERGRAASHRGRGWEQFTGRVVQLVNDEKEHIVFMLWGRDAQSRGAHIDPARHLVLKSPHPSPRSAASGFFGNRHFARANEYLARYGLPPVDWRVAGAVPREGAAAH